MSDKRQPIISGVMKKSKYIGEVVISPKQLRILANAVQKKYKTKGYVRVKASRKMYEFCSAIEISFIKENGNEKTPR